MIKSKKSESERINKKSNDSVSQFITNTFGTVAFLLIFIVMLLWWITLNLGFFPHFKPLDPKPFPGLELFLSAFAIFLSIAVLISQRRQAKLEKISEQVEFEVNLRAEKEITKVLQMLKQIQQKLGIDYHDPELNEMMENFDTERLQDEENNATS